MGTTSVVAVSCSNSITFLQEQPSLNCPESLSNEGPETSRTNSRLPLQGFQPSGLVCIAFAEVPLTQNAQKIGRTLCVAVQYLELFRSARRRIQNECLYVHYVHYTAHLCPYANHIKVISILSANVMSDKKLHWLFRTSQTTSVKLSEIKFQPLQLYIVTTVLYVY